MKISAPIPVPLICVLLAAAASPAAIAQTVTFTDSMANTSNWHYLEWGDATGTNSTLTVSSGGVDGGAFMQSTNTMGAGATYQAVQLQPTAVYNPATSGAISSIDFSLQTKAISGTQAVHFVVYQNNHVWMTSSTVATGSWTAFTRSGQTASSFGYGFDPTSQTLDFSASGAPITFGFLGSNTNYQSSSIVGFDDFAVTVHGMSAVPEPSTYAVLVGVGVLGFAAWRRSRRRNGPGECTLPPRGRGGPILPSVDRQ